MGHRFVYQPNGRFALFSDVVDDFVVMDMAEDEAMTVGTEKWGRVAAAEMLTAAVFNDGARDRRDALGRWREALESIELRHGRAVRTRRDRSGRRAAATGIR